MLKGSSNVHLELFKENVYFLISCLIENFESTIYLKVS